MNKRIRKFGRHIRRRSAALLLVFGLLLPTACSKPLPSIDGYRPTGAPSDKTPEDDPNRPAESKENSGENPPPTAEPTPLPTPSPTPEPTVRARIGMVGDVLLHDAMIRGAKRDDGTYNFDHVFEYIKPEIEKMDYAIFNMEGTLAESNFRGYPLFAAPDAIAEAAKGAGFDCAVTANNHILDRGTAGLQRTVQVLRDQGLDTVGARKETTDPTFLLKDINGIKVAISAYTWETIRQGDNSEIPGLNGIKMSELDVELIDSFSEQWKPRNFVAESQAEMTERIQEMKDAGAEVIMFIMHWGLEYHLEESSFAELYAQFLADSGVDLVLSCGPHVINPIRTLTSKDGNHEMLIFYSLGNYVSDQYYDTGNSNGHAEDGLFGTVTLLREPGQKVRIEDCGYIALYNWKKELLRDPLTNFNKPLPVNMILENPPAEVQEAPKLLSRLEASQKRTQKVMDMNTVREGLPVYNYTVIPELPASP